MMKWSPLPWLGRPWSSLRAASLLAQYTLVVVLVIGLVGIGLGYRLGQHLEALALEQEARSAADQVTNVLDPFLRPDDFDQPLSGERVSALRQLLQERILGGHIVRVKLWDRRGNVVYSDDPTLIGRQYEVEHELAEALGGAVATELSSLGKAENEQERSQYARLMEIYAPIRLGGEIVGAYEVYHDLTVLEPILNSMWRAIWLSLALGYGALYLGTLGVVWRASHRLRRQAEEVATLEAERNLNRIKDELVAVVSHELRTPLGCVMGFAELLLVSEVPEEERREYLTLIVKEGQRLTALLNDFLDLQRIESGRAPIRTEPTDLGSLLAQAVSLAGADPERPIVRRVPGALPPVAVDPDRIEQVLDNLLSNARKYSPAGGEIEVTARAVDHFVEVSIQDQGLGLPAEALPQLFGKFFRIDNSDRRRITGTGLGLSIARHLIEAHGGRIWAESAGLGQGSRFCFTVPIALTAPASSDSGGNGSASTGTALWSGSRDLKTAQSLHSPDGARELV